MRKKYILEFINNMSNQFKIIRKNVKNINIKIVEDGKVIITAPKNISNSYIDYVIDKKRDWIDKKIKLAKKIYKKNNLLDNDDIYYLGNSYKLKIFLSNSDEYAQMQDDKIILYTKNIDDFKQKEILIYKWYHKQAKSIFLDIIDKYNHEVNKPINIVRIKKMKTRWGSCNYQKGYINLNIELIKQPVKFIEYVILHELSHLIYPNHSKDFYNFIAKIMPDWRDRLEK